MKVVKKFAELITTVVAQQSDGIATSIIEYSQDIDSLFSGFWVGMEMQILLSI